MCNPIIGLGLGLAQNIVGFAAGQADFKAKEAAWRQNIVNSLAAERDEQGALLTRQIQEQSATGQKLHLSLVEEAQRRADAEVSAAAAGVSGLSVENLLRDVGSKAAYNRSVAEENYRMTAEQLTQEMRATETRAQSRINSVERPTSPSPLSLMIDMGSTVAAGANKFK